MKSATLTCHLCSSGLHTSVLHLKVDTSLSIYFFSCLLGKYTPRFALKCTRPRRQKPHPECFHYFTKAQVFVVIVNKRRAFTDSEDALLLPVWAKMSEYFKSKWVQLLTICVSCQFRFCRFFFCVWSVDYGGSPTKQDWIHNLVILQCNERFASTFRKAGHL